MEDKTRNRVIEVLLELQEDCILLQDVLSGVCVLIDDYKDTFNNTDALCKAETCVIMAIDHISKADHDLHIEAMESICDIEAKI